MSWSFVTDDQLRTMFHKPMSYTQIAKQFSGVTRNMVAGRCSRLGLVREGKPIKRPPPAPVISAAEKSERECDMRDLDILYDLQEGHSQGDCANFYGVSKTYVHKLADARRKA